MHEHRKHRRKQVHPPVAFVDGAGATHAASCRDLSLGGAFLETPSALEYGAQIVVVLRLPGLAEETRVSSIVRWRTEDGMGVQFGPMGARETHALTELLREPD